MTDTPEPPPAPLPPPAPIPQAAPPAPAAARPIPWTSVAIIGAIILVVIAGGFAYRFMQQRGVAQDAYTVQPYTPTTELITAHDRVEAHTQPSTASPIAVVYGAGVTLNINGRVQMGLGDDWYAVARGEDTVFVRAQDATAGSGAPPTPEVRERPPQVIEEEDDKEEQKPDEQAFPDTPQVAAGGMLEISQVSWVREPNARDFARFYPNNALDQGQSGNATLDCVIAGNGRLDCSVMSESPSGFGFGRAAVSISRQVRVRSTLPDGSSAAGRHLRLPLSFRAR